VSRSAEPIAEVVSVVNEMQRRRFEVQLHRQHIVGVDPALRGVIAHHRVGKGKQSVARRPRIARTAVHHRKPEKGGAIAIALQQRSVVGRGNESNHHIARRALRNLHVPRKRGIVGRHNALAVQSVGRGEFAVPQLRALSIVADANLRVTVSRVPRFDVEMIAIDGADEWFGQCHRCGVETETLVTYKARDQQSQAVTLLVTERHQCQSGRRTRKERD